MRIAIVNWSRRRVGGVETYLNSIIPQLSVLGHSLAFLYEVDKPLNREQIAVPESVPVWCVEDMGGAEALNSLHDWRPDLIYAHGLLDPELEAATIQISPAIFFAHSYYGTCISGTKTFKSPVIQPCDRRFGFRCLLNYYPRRCGGLNPITMFRLYDTQSKRLELMSRYNAIVTHSAHMRDEYIKHGLPADRIYDLLYYVRQIEQDHRDHDNVVPGNKLTKIKTTATTGADFETDNGDKVGWRLLFLGRMDHLKGGSTLLDALPMISAALRRPLHVTFAGEGPKRRNWERKAKQIAQDHPGVQIEFPGWLKGTQLDSLMTDCDLLVLPSLWPEPFGLVGPEAGLRGVPVAAFAVGGIPNWLVDGFNGYLAPGDHPTASGLAEAIVKCLRDPATLERLGRGATEMAARFDMHNHMTALMRVFEDIVSHDQ